MARVMARPLPNGSKLLLLTLLCANSIILLMFLPRPVIPVIFSKPYLHRDDPGSFKQVVSYFHKRSSEGHPVNVNHPSYRLLLSNSVKDLSGESGVALVVTPSEGVVSGQQVAVSWRDNRLHKRRSRDWIGLYCPPNSTHHNYLDYLIVSDVTGASYADSGEISVPIYNHRVECEFRYYSNDTCTELLARSDTIRFRGGREVPMHGHLALTGDPTQMRVQWTSGVRDTPTVEYGPSPDHLVHQVTGTSRHYEASDLCSPPASSHYNFIDPGFLHDTLITRLTPSTVYYYRYGNMGHYSDICSFKTASVVGSKEGFTFITYGDMGLSDVLINELDTAQLVGKDVRERDISFIMHQGDLAYAVGFSYIWDQWMELIEPLATKVPYMVAVGNHEQDHLLGEDPVQGGNGFHPSWGNYGHDSGGECGVPTEHRFHMPDNGNRVWWYSYKYGPAHFTIISTEHNFTRGSPQYEWIEKDLASVDRTQTPWLIVVGHRPMYNSEKYRSDYRVAVHIQQLLEDLLYQYKVDLCLWGHYHSYERTCRVYKNKCTPLGTIHITIGAAGAELDNVPQYDVEWSEHLEMNHGYGRVHVANGSALLWEFVRSVDRHADSYWITK